MKLWLDDIRPKPDETWCHCLTVACAKEVISAWLRIGLPFEEASLDNDLGPGEEEGRKLVLWMAERNIWPDRVSVHSANPVAVEYMEGMIRRYKPHGQV